MINLSCLDEYKGREVILKEKVHNLYVRPGKSSIVEKRAILLNSGEGFTTIFDYKRGSNKDFQKIFGAYQNIEERLENNNERQYQGDFILHLGPNKTLWHILDLETQKALFKHKQIGNDEYLVFGPNSKVLGLVKGNLKQYGLGPSPMYSKKGMNNFVQVEGWSQSPIHSIQK